MKTLHALELALQAQARQLDEAMRQLAAGRNELQAVQAQLEQLDQYAGETGRAWARPGETHGAARLQHHSQFMQKLHSAMVFQREVVASCESRIQSRAQSVTALGQRKAALEAVLAARRAELLGRQQRRDQRQNDELASLRYIHQRAQDRAGSHPA